MKCAITRWLAASVAVVVLSACSGGLGATGSTSTSAVVPPTAVGSMPVATTPASVPSVATPTPTATPAATPVPSGWLASTIVAVTQQPPGSIRLEMSGPPPIFAPSALTAAAGAVTFYLVNDSPAREEHGGHALAIGTKLGEPFVVSSEIKGGGRAAFTVKGLKAGRYVIWCPLYGHMELGQTGTLTVT
jgi:hypothetical protein